MKLLIYTSPSNAIGQDLLKTIRASGPEAGVETIYCPSLPALEKQLRSPLGLSPIGIMMPPDEDELAALIDMRRLLGGIRLILVLPPGHQQKEAHIRAHMLCPRFITHADRNLEEVIAVLWKMMETVCGAAV
jgi:hypothetical protein